MEDYNKSRSYIGNRQMMMQMESYQYHGGAAAAAARPSYDLRSYSVISYAQADQMGPNYSNKNKDLKLKKGKSISSSSSRSKSWSFADPEFQRKKRVASYKMYSVEGKMKGSFRKSFRWLKDRYWHVVYGRW